MTLLTSADFVTTFISDVCTHVHIHTVRLYCTVCSSVLPDFLEAMAGRRPLVADSLSGPGYGTISDSAGSQSTSGKYALTLTSMLWLTFVMYKEVQYLLTVDASFSRLNEVVSNAVMSVKQNSKCCVCERWCPCIFVSIPLWSYTYTQPPSPYIRMQSLIPSTQPPSMYICPLLPSTPIHTHYLLCPPLSLHTYIQLPSTFPHSSPFVNS